MRVPHLAFRLAAMLGHSHDLAGPGLVRWVIEKSANVVDEKRIEKLRDLFLVRKVQSSFKRDPDTLEMHWADLDHVSYLFAFEDTISPATSHASDV